MSQYWFSVLHRAFLGSLEAIGQSLYILLYTGLIFAIEALVFLRGQGLAKLKEQWVKEGLKLVLIAIAAWVPFFLGAILQTIYVMHAEARTQGTKDSVAANRAMAQKVRELELELHDARLLAETQKPIIVQQPSKPSGDSAPSRPHLKLDNIPFSPAPEDGLTRTLLHIWTDAPINNAVYLVACDQTIVRKELGCGCGVLGATVLQNPVGGLRLNGKLWDREKCFLFAVRQPNPVMPDYYIEVMLSTTEQERPRCLVQLVER